MEKLKCNCGYSGGIAYYHSPKCTIFTSNNVKSLVTESEECKHKLRGELGEWIAYCNCPSRELHKIRGNIFCTCECHKSLHPQTEKEYKDSHCANCLKDFIFCKCKKTEEVEDWANEYPLNTFSGETKKELTTLIKFLLSSNTEKVNKNIGMLRQWLNEDRIDDPKKMITNEDIKYWLEQK